MKTLQKTAGRPLAITEDVVAKLDSILKIGGTIEEACSYAGINKATYYRRLDADEDFATKMEAAGHYADIAAKNVVVDTIIKGKNDANAKWWLEKRQFKQEAAPSINIQNVIGNWLNGENQEVSS